MQKSVLERQGPLEFSSACEIILRTEWRVHHCLAAAVDALLTGKALRVGVRNLIENGSWWWRMCTSTPHNQVLAVMILAQASNTRPTGLIRVRRAITQVWISVQTEQLCRRRSAPILQYLHNNSWRE